MSRFEQWLKIREGRKELARTYKATLGGVPQDPAHHPEGDVLAHSRLVRKAIPRAIQKLQYAQTDPNNPLSDVLSNLTFRVSPEEEQILALVAWIHDLGKTTATTVGGEPWQKPGVQGRVQSIGHQEPTHYEPQLRRLKQEAPPETVDLYLRNQELVNWLVEHHMDLSAGQFSRRFVDEHFQNGRIVNSPQMRLLLILMWSDKMGRDPQTTVANIAKLSDKVAKSSQTSVTRSYRAANQSKPFEGSPTELAAMLKHRELTPQQRAAALRGKFPEITDAEIARLVAEGFGQFMEALQPTVIDEQIPMKPEELQDCMLLKRLLRTQHLYMVGGGVRDYLFHKFHGKSGAQYSPKDIDLTTDLSEEEILHRLSTPDAQAAGVKVNEKESVDTFGVAFVNVNGRDYEIAPFRRDVGSADGRRPERVEQAGIEEDAMRRDLTMNNLYYDFENQKILDFNPGGQGVEDIKNMVTRPVGDPFERFDEDKLRVLRLVRFFSRFNPGDIRQFLDERTAQAIEHFKDLPGITPERIYQEFMAGLLKSQNTAAYLKNYAALGLFDRVFPGLWVDESGIDRLGNTKNPKVVLAWLLRENGNVAQALNRLKYPNEVSDVVGFLVSALKFNPDQAMQVVKSRNRWLAKAGGPEQMSQDLMGLAQVAGREDLTQRLAHLGGLGNSEGEGWKWQVPPYEPPKISGEELMQQGIPQGPELGREIERRTAADYASSWQEFLRRKALSGQQPSV